MANLSVFLDSSSVTQRRKRDDRHTRRERDSESTVTAICRIIMQVHIVLK